MAKNSFWDKSVIHIGPESMISGTVLATQGRSATSISKWLRWFGWVFQYVSLKHNILCSMFNV